MNILEMNFNDFMNIVLNLALYGFALYVFWIFLRFMLIEIAPKIMTGKMTLRDFISFLVGAVIVLFMLATGPYLLGRAIQIGWERFRPIFAEISEDVITDFTVITNGDTVVIEPPNPTYAPTPIIVYDTPVPQVPTPTLAPTAMPTATPFDINQWTPDQPVPTPGG